MSWTSLTKVEYAATFRSTTPRIPESPTHRALRTVDDAVGEEEMLQKSGLPPIQHVVEIAEDHCLVR
jgi:hypothetical protein